MPTELQTTIDATYKIDVLCYDIFDLAGVLLVLRKTFVTKQLFDLNLKTFVLLSSYTETTQRRQLPSMLR